MKHYTIHATERVRERYGLEPTDEEWADTVLDIINAVGGTGTQALLLRRLNLDAELWIARLRGRCMKVVYQPTAARIITVLPVGA